VPAYLRSILRVLQRYIIACAESLPAMNRPTDQALLALLPTHASAAALPPQLVELANSLLAQSKVRASTLKADEEVARAFACAHIACERYVASVWLSLRELDP